jgi:PAS domain S-box-containing protein
MTLSSGIRPDLAKVFFRKDPQIKLSYYTQIAFNNYNPSTKTIPSKRQRYNRQTNHTLQGTSHMHYQFTFSLAPLLFAPLISLVVSIYTWRNRRKPGAAPFAILMFILFEWGMTYILHLAASDLPTKLFWNKVVFLGVVATPVAWLAFAVEYIGRKAWINTRRLVALSILPLATTIVVWTSGTHNLFWLSTELVQEGSFLVLKNINGPWFWVHAAYTYLLIMIGLVLIIRALLLWPAQYRPQMIAVIISTLTPLIANALTIFQLVPIVIDLTPFAFTVTGVGMAYALFRHRLLDIAPIARDLIINGMKDGVMIIDADRRIVDLNPAALEIVGLSGERRPIGKTIDDVLSNWKHMIEQYRSTENTEFEVSLGEGSAQRWYELRLSSLRDAREQFIGRVISARDITRRKQAEARLQENEARFRQIVENASDLIYRVDINGRFTYANPSALRAMGFEREEEMLGKFYLDLTTPEARHKLKRTYQHQFASRTPTTYHEFPAVAKDGNEVWFGQNVQLIYDEDQIVGFQCLARNTTAIKQAHDALRIARDQALEASLAKSLLLSKVSHELRTPLGGVLGYAELLRDGIFGDLNEEQKRVSTEIIESANYLTDMVNELLDEAQMQANTVTLREQNFSPAALLQASISGMEILAARKGLQFSTAIDEHLPKELYGDDHRLRQIIINLTGNAIKFTKKGSVSVNFMCIDQNQWQIQVSDTGTGIPKEAQTYIFDPFRQVNDAVTKDNRGIGLGLAITNQLVQLMNGKILLESETGKGTTFTVKLPIKQNVERSS